MTRSGNNGNSAQVLTATLLAEDSSKATMQQFLNALQNHNYPAVLRRRGRWAIIEARR